MTSNQKSKTNSLSVQSAQPKIWKKIGEGDDFVDQEEWSPPFDKYNRLSNILSNAEEFNQDIPWAEVTQDIPALRVAPLGEITTEYASTFEDLLKISFPVEINVDREMWDSGSPGASGFYVEAFVLEGAEEKIISVLDELQSNLVDWYEDSRLLIKVKEQELQLEKEVNKREEEKKAQLKNQKNEDRSEHKLGNNEIIKKITGYLESPNAPFFCAFHFLVTENKEVFVLDIEGWWHSTSIEAHSIVRKLELLGVSISRVKINETSRGWTSYFARQRTEELRHGWNERSLVIDSDDPDIKSRALSVQNSYLQWLDKK
jgi:hypothetical protein